MGRKHMSRSQLIEANKLLQAHLKVIGDGLVEYEEGWSDERISKELGNDLSKNSVSNMRLDLFGKFVRTIPNINSDQFIAVNERIDRLILDLQKMSENFSALALKHKKLIENLSLNRVLDVKHLA